VIIENFLTNHLCCYTTLRKSKIIIHLKGVKRSTWGSEDERSRSGEAENRFGGLVSSRFSRLSLFCVWESHCILKYVYNVVIYTYYTGWPKRNTI